MRSKFSPRKTAEARHIDTQSKLFRKLVEDRSLNNFQDQSFLPCDRIRDLVTRERVRSALAGLTSDNTGTPVSIPDRTSLENFILSEPGARRLFLILARTRLLNHLFVLKRHEFDDGKLPVLIKGTPNARTPGYPFQDRERNGRHDFFSEWDFNDWNLVCSTQWEFLAPKFGGETFHFEFHTHHPLPYLGREDKPADDGFFGEVLFTKIHKSHLARDHWHGPNNEETINIAIKRAKDHRELAGFFDREANNLQKIQSYRSPHLIKPIAAYKHGTERCLMFPWADGGNLWTYWVTHDSPNPNGDEVEVIWLISQFVGLCSALEELHTNETEHCVHGDLKPENILMFSREESTPILQIADMGLSAFHQEANTNMRVASGVGSGTSRYKPPEHDPDSPRSRSYDVWSMGCILLELLVWFTSGKGALQEFKKQTPYFWFHQPGGSYTIQPDVHVYMKIAGQKLRPESSFMDILLLIRTHLLVAKDNRYQAKDLHNKLNSIHISCQEEPSSYRVATVFPYPDPDTREIRQEPPSILISPTLDVPKPRTRSPRPLPRTDLDAPATAGGVELFVTEPPNNPNSSYGSTKNRDMQSRALQDSWESVPDNGFCNILFREVDWDQVKPKDLEETPRLCSGFHNLNSLAEVFPASCNLSDLQISSLKCDLCKMLLDKLRDVEIQLPSLITLQCNETHVGLYKGRDLLSLYTDPFSHRHQGRPPLGLPRLLDPDSMDHFKLLQQWLKLCDSEHDKCRREVKKGQPSMPTRLLEVSKPPRLIESRSITPERYVALSHCWGIVSKRFSTVESNFSQLKKSIDIEALPQTFRDAIQVTRGLGIKYIWIDSLCIIQDDEKDWYREAGKMELVFSEAYCTIGASSARSSVEGFLARGPPRRCLQLSIANTGNVFVCPAIDDFHKDVELGPLNRRGWVLQERALSRRTIYYTSTQVYWECGEGVRCETLGCLQKLDFTRPTDRPVALLGLQKRMANAFCTSAAYGMFSAFFPRGLLWKRAQQLSCFMEPIQWAPGHQVPSWSWLSKLGAIEYLRPEFETVSWATKEFKRPMLRDNAEGDVRKEGEEFLEGLARPVLLGKGELSPIVYDLKDDYDRERLRCIVIGRDKVDTHMTAQKFYALIIHPKADCPSDTFYERVGVGILRTFHIGDGGSWVKVI
ncbi:HET-domain-containing protein [Apiospora marii]|uniref:HET-domain-containing protein n=1 Tax=Apiospora marii TaxID=335849 RepID=A0ABR1SBZ5_9PEZI